VEEINEHHVSAWTEMITNSKPPIPNTALSAYLDKYALEKHFLAYKNNKLKEMTNYQLKRPKFCQETIVEMIDMWKSEGTWPNL
jgi:hypothetical protein